MTNRAIIPPQFNWLSQVVEHFESRGYQPEMEADNVAHTILTPEESIVPDETREILYSILPIRFWVKTELTDTCWVWLAGKLSEKPGQNYGIFNWAGKTQTVHRLIWKLLHGEASAEMVVCHKCDNPPCFNPSHLFLGTQKDNQADSTRKGRHVTAITKLTAEQVRAIKVEIANGGKPPSIAKRYDVGRTTVENIKSGRTWTHIEVEGEKRGVKKRRSLQERSGDICCCGHTYEQHDYGAAYVKPCLRDCGCQNWRKSRRAASKLEKRGIL